MKFPLVDFSVTRHGELVERHILGGYGIVRLSLGGGGSDESNIDS